jgi:predicted GH43/DUF377 family glycosyl hydrolase
MLQASLVLVLCSLASGAEPFAVPPALQPWLVPQDWQRDTAGPVLSLGKKGAFDDQHLFAPCVCREKGQYSLWYSGSRGKVAERIFQLGLATSKDGKHFTRHPSSPVFRFPDGKRSILTPTLLRNPDGSVLREEGKLRLWFSAANLTETKALHTLHETTSEDGLRWAPPSPAELQHVYAPTILKEKDRYHMWYTDVSSSPWVIRHAWSKEGKRWEVTAKPVLVVDQKWEKGRLFYPTVVKEGQVYLMWYGSYWAARANTTALGFAVSLDGVRWYKNPHNPVLRPDPAREWESHYNTSQSVLKLPDGSWRIWYASRSKPPFVHKYFAIGTARGKRNERATDEPR